MITASRKHDVTSEVASKYLCREIFYDDKYCFLPVAVGAERKFIKDVMYHQVIVATDIEKDNDMDWFRNTYVDELRKIVDMPEFIQLSWGAISEVSC